MNADTIALLQMYLPMITVGVTAVCILLFCLVLYLLVSVSRLKARYNAMMTGADTGARFESMMLAHIEETRKVAAENQEIKSDLKRIDALLQRAVTRVGIVRFRAFEEMGSDLSYAVALLDAHNNGVVFSSIFARSDSRSYAKPIEDGKSAYTLTQEEEDAMRKARAGAQK